MNQSNDIKNELLKVLKYFDFFRFPLTESEILKFIGIKITLKNLQKELTELVQSQKIFLIEDCYLLVNDPERVVRKKQGRKLAAKRMKRAHWISKVIMSFPFVRMVAVSGSLSKGYADSNSDIDFFIITTENQLWTSRSLLHVMKKISFLFRMQHSFCMNYFISEGHLTLEEQNYFTGIELATLIPLKGKSHYSNLIKNNQWVNEYVPNFDTEIESKSKSRIGIFKRLFETFFSSKKWNVGLMEFTDKRWKKKWTARGYSEDEYELAFKTKLTVSKNHPSNFQKKILKHMEEKE